MKRLLSYFIRHYLTMLPDKLYLQILFYIETGKVLHLQKPQTFQEKIQWFKLNYRCSKYTQMVDKIAVKEYVASVIGKEYINSTIGCWDNWGQIDFSKLPEQFVIKTSHGGGNCGVVICKDKKMFDKMKAKLVIEKSLKEDIYCKYKEWPYKDVPRRIFAEPFLVDSTNEELVDYKFFCFGGKPLFCQVIRNRNICETIDFYDMNWQLQEFVGLNPKVKNGKTPVPKPIHFEEMVEICCKLSKNLPFVRVDLYNIQGKIFFGELTFFPASGFGRFEPEIWNFKLGSLLQIPTKLN